MKRNATEHPKAKILCNLLKIDLAKAIGTLELMWHFTANFTPRGNIGAYPNDIIADRVAWSKDPQKLIDALVEARLLDKDPEHRLLVHDWKDHCEDAVHIKLAKKTELFADGTQPNLHRINKDLRGKIEERYALMRENAHQTRINAHCLQPTPTTNAYNLQPTPTNPPISPKTKKSKSPWPLSGDDLAAFERVYGAYPADNRKGKREGMERWKRYGLQPSDADRLIAAIQAYSKTKSFRAGYIKNFSTWMNGCWEDHYEPEKDKEGIYGGENDELNF